MDNKKERLKNTDKILRKFKADVNTTLKIKELKETNFFKVNKSNITRLFQNLIRLGILKVVSKGEYALSDYLLNQLKNKQINLLEIYKEVRNLLQIHYKQQNNPDINLVKLKREDLKYLMVIDGLIECDRILNGQGEGNNILEQVKEYLIGKYGHNYIDRTIEVIQEVLEVDNENIAGILSKIKKNQVNNVNLIHFITNLETQTKQSIFDSICKI